MGVPVNPAGGGKMKYLALLLLVALNPANPVAGVEDMSPQKGKEKAFMVREYRYEPPEGEEGNRDIGQSLCGTRCNALSDIFGSYLKPRNWRLVKIAGDVEQSVELDNPFLKGKCICVGDEYRIDWFDPIVPENQPEAAAERSGRKTGNE